MHPNTNGLRCHRCRSVVDGFSRPDPYTTTLHCGKCGPVEVLSAQGMDAMIDAMVARVRKAEGLQG